MMSGQPLYSKVLTPGGFITMEGVHVGTMVVGIDGKAYKVEATHSYPDSTIVEVTTNDGILVECSATQLWLTTTPEAFLTSASMEGADQTLTLPFLLEAPELRSDMYEDDELPEAFLFRAMLDGQGREVGHLIFSPPHRSVQDRTGRGLAALPEYVLMEGEADENPKIIYTEEALSEDPLYALLKEAGLFSGDPDTFRIPSAYLTSGVPTRRNLLKAFSEASPSSIHTFYDLDLLLTGINFNHPNFGGVLKELVFSMGWTLDSKPRRIVAMRYTGSSEETKSFIAGTPKDLYLTDGFVVLKGLPRGYDG